MNLQELRSQNVQCTRCSLRSGCKQVVPGEGPETADIMFIAEAPGETEDDTGRPLVGRAGDMFRRALRNINISESSVVIENVCCCRPPNNREPTPEEEDACWGWLEHKIAIVKPKVIVTMGRHAIQVLANRFGFQKKIGKLSITKIAGKPIWLDNYTCYVLPMTHPSYAMRRNDAREEYEGFFQYLARALPGWKERVSDENSKRSEDEVAVEEELG